MIRKFLQNIVNFVTPNSGENREVAESAHDSVSLPVKRKCSSNLVNEPYFTDDEDSLDCSHTVYEITSKRPKSQLEFSYQPRKTMNLDKITTRSSGISPCIEGREKQPWEYNFKDKKASSDEDPILHFRKTKSVQTKLPPLSHRSESVNTTDLPVKLYSVEDSDDDDDVVIIKDTLRENQQKSQLSPEKPALNFLPSPSYSRSFATSKSTKIPFQPSKIFKKSNFRERNILGKSWLKSYNPRDSIRLNEKQKFLSLLKDYNVFKTNSRTAKPALPAPLSKTRCNMEEVIALYKKPDDATSPMVKFHQLCKSRDLGPLQKESLLDRSLDYRCPGSVSGAYKHLDSSSHFKPTHFSSPLLTGPTVFSPEKLNKSFRDLDDALSSYRELKTPAASTKELVTLSDETIHVSSGFSADEALPRSIKSSEQQDDDDVVFIAEKIISKHRPIINSLALQQISSPYVSPKWLQSSQHAWSQDEEERKKKIREEELTLDILRNESSIERELRERIRDRLKLPEVIVLDEPVKVPEVEEEIQLPEISLKMKEIIKLAVSPGPMSEVLSTIENIEVSREDIKSLAPTMWLNDNVINAFMALIVKRSKEGTFPKCYAFSTFFFPKLQREGYSNALKRWTRKVDIFSYDLLLLPLHLGLHWVLAVANLRNKQLKYYDSLHGDGNDYLHVIMDYLESEHKERKKSPLPQSDWVVESLTDIPQQQNGSDCGMFTCKFAEFISRDASIQHVAQENMNYYRRRMVYELVKKDLMFP